MKNLCARLVMAAFCAVVTPVEAFSATYVIPVTNRARIDLSLQPWKFTTSNSLTGTETVGFNDASWATVTIPHTWNSHANRSYYTNCWYRTHFTGSSSDTAGGKRFYLYFEGVMSVANVYLNGTWLGQHCGGYTAFIFDATNIRIDGDNVVAVRVDNNSNPGLPAQQTGWMHFGGIHRKVWILTTDKYSVDPTDFAASGVYVTQSNVSTAGATVSIKTMVRNYDVIGKTFTVKNIVCDNTQTIVATLQGDVAVAANSGGNTVIAGSVSSPTLWSLGAPNLYHVYTEVWVDGTVRDMVDQRIGFRYYALTQNSFTINGAQKLLRGVCLHSENEYKGNAVDSLDVKAQLNAVQDLGMNYIRLVHYEHPDFTYNMTDELGIGVSTETGDWGSSADIRNATRDTNVIELVKQRFNHPSILFWCAGNEDSYDANIERWAFVIDSIDGSKPVYFAANGASPTGVDFIAENIYPGWYGTGLTGFPNGNHYVSESGAGGVITSHQDYKLVNWTVNTWEPEEYQELVNEFKINYVYTVNPASIPLYSHWVLSDVTDDKYKWMNTKGILTYAGMPKDCYYIWKAQARPTSPVVHLCGKFWCVRTTGKDIKVYANRPSIALSVNGVSKGSKSDGAYTTTDGSVIHDVFFFDTVLCNGRNTVIASDGSGNSDTAVIYYTGAATAAPADNAACITNLVSSNANDSAYFVNIPLHAQWPVYYQCDGKADNTFDTIPQAISNARWIATKRQSDTASTTNLSFTIRNSAATGADVFIMFTQQTSIPSWVTSAGFANTNVNGRWRDNSLNLVNYQLYKKTFTAGATVSLGSSAIDFVVLVNPLGLTKIGPESVQSLAPAKHSSLTFKAIGRRIAVPQELTSRTNEIAVYDLSGRCVQRSFVEGSILNLQKDRFAAGSVYVLKATSVNR